LKQKHGHSAEPDFSDKSWTCLVYIQ